MVDSDQADQPPVEERTHTFVVKFWQEIDPDRVVLWRGHVTHIPSRRRVYVQSVAEVQVFIQSYLASAEAT